MAVKNLHKFHVDALRKMLMLLQCGTDGTQRRIVRVVTENNAVGIAHRNGHAGDFLLQCSQSDGIFHHCLAHLHCRLLHKTVFHVQFQSADARQGFNIEGGFAGVAFVVHKFSHAADTVAAHFRFAAVGIENAHFEVGDLGILNQNQAVGADTEVPVRPFNGQLRRILHLTVVVEIVVAKALHFRQMHTHYPFSFDQNSLQSSVAK